MARMKEKKASRYDDYLRKGIENSNDAFVTFPRRYFFSVALVEKPRNAWEVGFSACSHYLRLIYHKLQ